MYAVRKLSRVGNKPEYNSFDDVVKEGRDPKYNRRNPNAVTFQKKSSPYTGLSGGSRDAASEIGPHTIDVYKQGYGYPEDAKNGQKYTSKKDYLASRKN
jgi:hypothetical protein